MFDIYSQFGLPLIIIKQQLDNSYFIILISKRDNFAVRGPSSFKLNSLFQILKFVVTIYSNLLLRILKFVITDSKIRYNGF